MVEPLLDLLDRASVEADFDVAKTYVAKFNNDAKAYPTTTEFFSEHCEALKAMTTVHLARKLRITFRASTAKRENFFSVLKTIMRDCRQSMKQARKAHLD